MIHQVPTKKHRERAKEVLLQYSSSPETIQDLLSWWLMDIENSKASERKMRYEWMKSLHDRSRLGKQIQHLQKVLHRVNKQNARRHRKLKELNIRQHKQEMALGACFGKALEIQDLAIKPFKKADQSRAVKSWNGEIPF